MPKPTRSTRPRAKEAKEAVTPPRRCTPSRRRNSRRREKRTCEPQSDTPGAALLDPQGITVDPATEEVIVLAHIDEAGNANDSIKRRAITSCSSASSLEPARQRHTLTKPTSSKKRSTDLILSPTSPVVVQGSKEGEERLMVDWAFGLTEVPYPCTKENTTTKSCEAHGFGSTAPVTLGLSQPFPGGGSSGENEQEGLLAGAQLPIEPEATKRTIRWAEGCRRPPKGRCSVPPM